MRFKTLLAIAIMSSSMAVAASASAEIINLSATTAAGPAPTAANGVTLDLAAGDYTISAISSEYTAAQLATNGAYSVPFTVSYTGYDKLYYNAADAFGTYQATFSTPQAALTAFQTGPVWERDGVTGASVELSGPITLNLASDTAVDFSVTDYGQTYDNSAGVSLSITPAVSAAPEPSAWLLMIVGVGLTGLALRRKSAASPLVA